MTLPQGADYSLTESALIPFQAEPAHAALRMVRGHFRRHLEHWVVLTICLFNSCGTTRLIFRMIRLSRTVTTAGVR